MTIRLITDTLAYALGKDFDVLASDSRQHAVSLLRQRDEAPQLALVDLGLPPVPHRPDEGFALIGDLLAHSPPMKIFVLSGQNDAAHARHARALGAAEFVAKPCDPVNLKRVLDHALHFRAAEISSSGDGRGGHADRTQRGQCRNFAVRFPNAPTRRSRCSSKVSRERQGNGGKRTPPTLEPQR